MGRRKRVSWLSVVLLWGGCVGLESLALDQDTDCNATQYKQSQRCCSRCPPGQKVRTECPGTSGDTVCEPCEMHHFQASWTKEKYCTPHRECPKGTGLVVHVPGTATQDVECRCQSGTHCASHECHTCRRNTLCGPGRGVQREGTHKNDTICVDCPEGSFSNVSSATARCQPWTSCEDQNLVQKVKGTPFSDVVCDFQSSPPGDAKRAHLLALLPLAAVLLLGGIFGLWYWQRRRRGLQKRQPNQGLEPEENECLPCPIPETLPGGHLVAQEEGKESHLAVEEEEEEEKKA